MFVLHVLLPQVIEFQLEFYCLLVHKPFYEGKITDDDIESTFYEAPHWATQDSARERLYGEIAASGSQPRIQYDTGFLKGTHQHIAYSITARKMCANEGEKSENGNPI